MERFEVNKSNLIFLDDFTDFKSINLGNVVLTDHNALAEHQSELASKVTEILDHHVDEGKYPNVVGPFRSITVVGSACSLVALRFLDSASNLLSLRENWCVTQMLTAVILLDTDNMNPSYGKGTPQDAAALEYLATMSRTSFLANLVFLRTDTSTLTTAQLLRKDLKAGRNGSWSHSISSCPLPLHDWLRQVG